MSTGGQEETNEKLISNFSQNEIDLKRAEFKTSAVINIVLNLLAQTRTLNY